MPQRQLALFSAAGFRPEASPRAQSARPRLTPAALDEEALVTAIPAAALADCHGLAAEAGLRRLARAVPALEALCRRFKGFGTEQAIPEQSAALQGLGAIGGREAAQAVARIIVERVVQGPGLEHAVEVAARIGARLSSSVVVSLLEHPAPAVRASACRCAGPWPDAIRLLIELLGDLNGVVATEAACALGRMGRTEGRPSLARLLRQSPSVDVLEAAAAVADEECLILLGRLARSRPDLAEAALAALDSIEEPRATVIAAAVRRAAPELRTSRR